MRLHVFAKQKDSTEEGHKFIIYTYNKKNYGSKNSVTCCVLHCLA